MKRQKKLSEMHTLSAILIVGLFAAALSIPAHPSTVESGKKARAGSCYSAIIFCAQGYPPVSKVQYNVLIFFCYQTQTRISPKKTLLPMFMNWSTLSKIILTRCICTRHPSLPLERTEAFCRRKPCLSLFILSFWFYFWNREILPCESAEKYLIENISSR